MSNLEPFIKTTLQLRICFCMLKLTEIKRNLGCDGWFFKTELVDLVKAKYTTIDSFLQRLEKKGVIKYLPHVTKTDWQGGVLKLTTEGEKEIKTELEKSLSFKDINKSLKKIQPILK